MADWADIDALVAGLPETEDGMSRGLRVWRIRKKLLAWERPMRARERAHFGDACPTGEIVGLPTFDVFERDELITCFPDVFFTTPHFDGYAAVLARLGPLPVDAAGQLVRQAWLRSAPKTLVRSFLADRQES